MTTQFATTTIVATGTIRNGEVTLKTNPAFAPAVTFIDNDPGLATPFQVGVMDAEDKFPFCPEEYFMTAVQKLEYAMGFASLRPDCEPAQDMIAKLTAAFIAQADEDRDDTHDRATMWQG